MALPSDSSPRPFLRWFVMPSKSVSRQAQTADSENDKPQNLRVSNSGRFPLLEPHDRAYIDDNTFSRPLVSVFEPDTRQRVYLAEKKQASCATSAANHLPARVKKSRLEQIQPNCETGRTIYEASYCNLPTDLGYLYVRREHRPTATLRFQFAPNEG